MASRWPWVRLRAGPGGLYPGLGGELRAGPGWRLPGALFGFNQSRSTSSLLLLMHDCTDYPLNTTFISRFRTRDKLEGHLDKVVLRN